MRIINLPRWFPVQGVTLTPRLIAIRRGLEARERRRRLLHEMMHTYQMERSGPPSFYLHYLFSPRRRIAYEAEAYAVSDAQHVAEQLGLTVAHTVVIGAISRHLRERYLRWWYLLDTGRRPSRPEIWARVASEVIVVKDG